MASPAEPAKTLATPERSLGVVTAALATSLLVLDAGLETFISGAPVRWYVAGTVAAYVIVSWFLWRRSSFTWSARLTTGLVFLAALLTLVPWLPDGLTDGIRLLGQPTSRVLSLVTMAAIVLAGVSLLRLAWLPRWSKIAIGALTVYAVAAFVKGLISGADYPDLLHGESLWTRLPSWLQGACIGALLVVPLGLVARAAQMLHATPSISRTWDLRAVVAMAMSVLMAASAMTSTGVFGPQPTAAEIVGPLTKSNQELQQVLAGPKPKTPLTPQQVADRLDKLFPMLEQAEKQIPRDTFDPQAIIDKVGNDPRKLFEWVRDNTYFVPYKGLLRGEKGVLMDRLGNSLDRAMLLYSLLKYVDQPARLAHGTLTEAQAKDVLAKVRPFPSFEERTGSGSSAVQTDAFIKEYAEQNQLDAGKIRKALDQVAAQQQRVRELVEKRVAAQTEMISRLIGTPPKGVLETERADQVRAITDHWWVQFESGAQWIDFDPTLSTSQTAQALTSAQSTVMPTSYTDVGADLVHSVQIQIVIEVWKNGRLQEIPVLKHTFLPAELDASAITLRHIPVNWPLDTNFSGADPMQALNSVLLAQHEWVPVLSVGDESFLQSSFTDSGELRDGQLALNAVASGVDAAGKAFGSFIGSGQIGNIGVNRPSVSDKPAGTVVSEWIKYEIVTPDSESRTIRRRIFDLLHPALRVSSTVPPFVPTVAQRRDRSMILLGKTAFVLLGNSLSQSFVSHVIMNNWLINRDAFVDAMTNSGTNGAKPIQEKSRSIEPLPVSLYALCLALRGVTSPSDIYLDRENVFSYHQEFRATRTGILNRDGFDIVANEVAVKATANDAFLSRVRQGVLDTNMEAVLIAMNCYSTGGCKDVANTSDLVEEARTDHVRWLAVRGRIQSWSKAIEVRPRVYLDVKRALSTGYTAILPVKPVRANGWQDSGWWRIDPREGHTLGMDEDGRGGGPEHATWGKVAMVEGVVAAASYVACGFLTCHGFKAPICFVLPVGEFVLGMVIFWQLLSHSLSFAIAVAIQMELAKHAAEHGPGEHEPCGSNNPPGPEPSPVPTPAGNTQSDGGGSGPTWPPNNPNPGPTPPPQQQNAPPLPWPPGVSAADPPSCWDIPKGCQPLHGERGNSQHAD